MVKRFRVASCIQGVFLFHIGLLGFKWKPKTRMDPQKALSPQDLRKAGFGPRQFSVAAPLSPVRDLLRQQIRDLVLRARPNLPS